jgi:hypothetical protein
MVVDVDEEYTRFLFYSPFPINSFWVPCIAIIFSAERSLYLLIAVCLLVPLLDPEYGGKTFPGTYINFHRTASRHSETLVLEYHILQSYVLLEKCHSTTSTTTTITTTYYYNLFIDIFIHLLIYLLTYFKLQMRFYSVAMVLE